MKLGIFAKTFVPASLPDILDAVVANGLQAIHFNMACAGLAAMPDVIDPAILEQIHREVAARRLTMVGVSGTYNMIDPDLAQRAEGLRRLEVLAAACRPLGVPLITLCTGTCDPEDKWRFHPDNASPAAWHAVTGEMAKALEIAERYDVTLGIEPELSNVVDSAAKAQKLLAEMRSERLKIVIDPANLLPAGALPRQRQIIDEALALLADDVVMAHAKDLAQDGQAGDRAAGTGQLDFVYYLSKLQEIGFDGPLIMHGLTASEAPQTVQFLENILQR